MRTTARLILLAAAVAAAPTLATRAAQAQTIILNGGNTQITPRPAPPPAPAPAPAPARRTMVTMNLQVTTPLPAMPSADEITGVMATANQSLYQILNRQCDLLKQALKGEGECRLVQLITGGTVNARNQPNQGQQPTAGTNANATFEIELAAAPATPVATPTPPN